MIRRILPLFALGFSTLLSGCAADAVTEDVDDGSGQAWTTVQEVGAGYALGLNEGVRASSPTKKVTFDTQKMSFTARGRFTIHAFFEPVSEAEGADVPQADLFQMNFDVTFDEYARLFESSDDASIEPREGDVYTDSAEASGPASARKVVLRWESSTRKGEMTLLLGAEGRIAQARMTKFAKGSPGGWKKVFDESLAQPTRGAAGLLLRDEEFSVRVRDEAKVRSAVEDSSPENFRSLAAPSGT